MAIPQKIELRPLEEKKESRIVRKAKNTGRFLLRAGLHLGAILAISAAATPVVDYVQTRYTLNLETSHLSEENRALLRPITEIEGSFSTLEEILEVAQMNTTAQIEYLPMPSFENRTRAVLNHRGDCNDYASLTYAGVYNYLLEKEEHLHYLNDIRLVFGYAGYNANELAGHSWLQFYSDGKWKDFEVTIDLNGPGGAPQLYPIETYLISDVVEYHPMSYVWLDRQGQKHYKIEDTLSFGERVIPRTENLLNNFIQADINLKPLSKGRIEPSFYIVLPIVGAAYRGVIGICFYNRKDPPKPLNKMEER